MSAQKYLKKEGMRNWYDIGDAYGQQMLLYPCTAPYKKEAACDGAQATDG